MRRMRSSIRTDSISGVQLIVKPFNSAGLAAKIRQMFDESE
jgi:hypothetical protein